MRNPTPTPPFPFLSLPPELRLQIYTHLPTTLIPYSTRHPSEPSHRTTLFLKSFPTALLQTCRQIHIEARPIVQATLQSFMLDTPPRIIDGVSARGEGRMLDAVVRAVVKQVDALRGHELGRGPCLGMGELFEGVMRGQLMSRRGGRFVVKWVHQVGHAVVYGNFSLSLSLSSPLSSSPRGGVCAIEMVKYVEGGVSGMGRYWVLAGDLHALNRRVEGKGMVVVCRGVIAAGVVEGRGRGGVVVPQRVDFGAYGLDCYAPCGRQMSEEEWVEGWRG